MPASTIMKFCKGLQHYMHAACTVGQCYFHYGSAHVACTVGQCYFHYGSVHVPVFVKWTFTVLDSQGSSVAFTFMGIKK
jgi:hypothetical protein